MLLGFFCFVFGVCAFVGFVGFMNLQVTVIWIHIYSKIIVIIIIFRLITAYAPK